MPFNLHLKLSKLIILFLLLLCSVSFPQRSQLSNEVQIISEFIASDSFLSLKENLRGTSWKNFVTWSYSKKTWSSTKEIPSVNLGSFVFFFNTDYWRLVLHKIMLYFATTFKLWDKLYLRLWALAQKRKFSVAKANTSGVY